MKSAVIFIILFCFLSLPAVAGAVQAGKLREILSSKLRFPNKDKCKTAVLSTSGGSQAQGQSSGKGKTMEELEKAPGDKGLQKLNQLALKLNYSEFVRDGIARAASEIGGGDELKILKVMARQGRNMIGAIVAEMAGKIGGEGGLEVLNYLIEVEAKESTTYFIVYAYIVYAAIEIGGEGGAEILHRLSRDKSSYVQETVAETAGKIDSRNGLEILNRLAGDKEEYVRQTVAETAGEIGGEGGAEILSRLSRDQSSYVRETVAETAGKIDSKNRLKILNRLARDKDEYVREAVAIMARKIGGEEGQKILNRIDKFNKYRFWIPWW